MMVMYNNNDINYNYIDGHNSWKDLQICWLNEKSTHLNIKWQAFAILTQLFQISSYTVLILLPGNNIKHFLVAVQRQNRTEQMHSQFSVQLAISSIWSYSFLEI